MALLTQEARGFFEERASTESVPLAIKEEQAQREEYQGLAFHVAQVPEERQGLLVVGSCCGILALVLVRHPLEPECPAQASLVPQQPEERRALLKTGTCLAVFASPHGTDP